MRFSLILPTINRPKEIFNCLISLDNQIFKDFEIIIIDQSENSETKNEVEKFMKNSTLNINYNKVLFKGLSKARNYGIKFAKGDYICLLDDDARYDINFLDVANNAISKNTNKKLILSGKIVDDTINEEYVEYSCVKNNEIFSDNRIFKVCLSAGLIIPKNDIIKIGIFDERFGIGEYFGAAEETDLILRLIEIGFEVIHLSDMILYHLKPKDLNNIDNLEKIYKYALGGGALFKKHIKFHKNKTIIIRYIRSILAPMIKLIINIFDSYKRKKYILTIKGHIRGFIEFN